MKHKLTISVIILSTLFLSGCEEKYSRDWYIEHHKEMIEKYTECLLDGTWEVRECQNARDALKHERHKPDVIKGLKDAYAKLDAKVSAQPIPDLNGVN